MTRNSKKSQSALMYTAGVFGLLAVLSSPVLAKRINAESQAQKKTNSKLTKDLKELKTHHGNIRLFPYVIFAWGGDLSFDIPVGERFTVGPSFTYALDSSYDLGKTSLGMIGVQSRFHLAAPVFESGPYLSARAAFGKLDSSATYMDTSASFSSNVLFSAGLLGYHWYLDSGFNLGLGFGLRYVSATNKEFSFSQFGLGAEATIGFLL